MTIKEWTAANADKKREKKNPIAKLYGVLKGKIKYNENTFNAPDATNPTLSRFCPDLKQT